MKHAVFALLLLSSFSITAQTPEEKLKQLGIELPKLPSPAASYVNAVQTGKLIYLSGKGPQKEDGTYINGKLGAGLTVEAGYEAARLTAINQLAVLKSMLGDLLKVKKIVKVNGFVNSDPQFYDHPKVINGFSELLIKVFADKGQHARTSIGVSALPFNMAVEVEMIVEVE